MTNNNASGGRYAMGVDVGSTTVKYVICDPSFNICAKAYEAHDTRQAETLLRLLSELSENEAELFAGITTVYVTGSGASLVEAVLNARFVQEVNSVVLAVEFLHPDVNAVIELGGQDAKIIHFKPSKNGGKSVLTSMNDKCASGTGATIEKCTMKAGLSRDQLQVLKFNPDKLHHVAAKCGVFAETDIVNLVKTSVPSDEVMNSLADAIVMQNLTVLTRGNTLMPKVLLLGGPNTYLPFLQACWRIRITELWDERDVVYDADNLESEILVPDNAQYYAALGAVIFGQGEASAQQEFAGLVQLKRLVEMGGTTENSRHDNPLVKNRAELKAFREAYAITPFVAPLLTKKTVCYLGIDGGSTSSKAVLVDEAGQLLIKTYQLSKGNPIQDTLELLEKICQLDPQNYYDIKGLGVTGYAADVLEGTLDADANIVETIAHMRSAQQLFGDAVDVICDIGGQDIKVMFLENGTMKNFRLSNQCSAGNGTLLQSMAKQFGVAIEDYAEVAFDASLAPRFNYGCAVFLDTDRVNFQKEGFSKESLFAGIAKVLPKNIWQYVVQAENLAALGNHFVLQGGTQYNQAALKSQVDYIKARVPGARVDLHPHCGEAGALGAALEARSVVQQRGYATFVGMASALKLSYNSRTDETTRCDFCSINCSRTFIDTKIAGREPVRYIAGFSCEKGTVESMAQLQSLQSSRRSLQKTTPNLVHWESNRLFSHFFKLAEKPTAEQSVESQKVRLTLGGWGPTLRKTVRRAFQVSRAEAIKARQGLKFAIPKVLNVYSVAPFLRAYLEALEIKPRNIYFTDFSNEDMFLQGAKYGSVDACYPAKVAQAHVYSLMFERKFTNKKINFIWFPSVSRMPGYVSHTQGQTSCPIVSGTPRVVYSSFVKEQDLFEKTGLDYIDSALDFEHKNVLEQQLFDTFSARLSMTRDESDWAVEQAWSALQQNDDEIMAKGRALLDQAQAESKIVLLLLGRPYHSDPGLNHEVLDLFQSLGFVTLSMRSIPKDAAYLQPYFSEDLDNGYIEDCFDIRDVWPENFSTNSAQKVWAAKFAARHPNVAVVDLSSFKCGHDAPTYAIIDRILATSKTPHLTLHDVDANKPSGSIKIRVKTFAYTLEQYRQRLSVTQPDQSRCENGQSSGRQPEAVA